MEKWFNRFWKWLLWSGLFAIIIHCLFKFPAPFPFLEGVWGAGDLLTYISTILLAWIAFWQNQRYKEESDRYQKEQDRVAEETQEKFLLIQENIERQTKLLASLEHEKMTPYIRIGGGLTESGRGRHLTISDSSPRPLPQYIAHIKNIGVNSISNIICRELSINDVPQDIKCSPSPFGIDDGEVCFIMFPHLQGETQTMIFEFDVWNVIGSHYTLKYKLPFDSGRCLVGELLDIKRYID